MKKWLSCLLMLVLMLSLFACTDATSSDDDGANPPSQGENGDGAGNTDKSKITFDGLVAVDNAECFVKITAIDPDNMWGYTLKAQMENRSAEKQYTFSLTEAAVNGVVCSSLFASEIAAGKKANEDISLLTDALKENGVGDFTDIELTFYVYDSNDFAADPVAEETVHIYPYGQEKAKQFVRADKATDRVILENDAVRVIVTGYEKDEIFGYHANFFLLNKRDKNLMFSADDVSVNGYMADPLFATTVPAGKCAFASMSWTHSALEENSITSVEEIEFMLRVYDNDDWAAEDIANEKITLKP